MTTALDDAVAAFVAALAGTDQVGTRIYEDRPQTYTKGDAPALDVSLKDAVSRVLGDDSPARSVLDVVAEVELAIYTRGALETDGTESSVRQLAAPIWESAHRRLMADPTLGGKALRVRWRRSTWRRDQADGTAGWTVHTYELRLAMRELTLLAP